MFKGKEEWFEFLKDERLSYLDFLKYWNSYFLSKSKIWSFREFREFYFGVIDIGILGIVKYCRVFF